MARSSRTWRSVAATGPVVGAELEFIWSELEFVTTTSIAPSIIQFLDQLNLLHPFQKTGSLLAALKPPLCEVFSLKLEQTVPGLKVLYLPHGFQFVKWPISLFEVFGPILLALDPHPPCTFEHDSDFEPFVPGFEAFGEFGVLSLPVFNVFF